MPTFDKQAFMNATQDVKRQILRQRAEARGNRERKLIRKTMAAQKGQVDKIWLAIYNSIKKDTQQTTNGLTDEERFDRELSIGSTVQDDHLADELTNNVIDSIVPEPTLENIRAMYFFMGMTSARASYDLSKEQKRIKDSLPQEYSEETRQKLSEVLALKTGSLPNMIDNHAGIMLQDMSRRTGKHPVTGQNADYETIMNHLLEQDLRSKLVPAEHPTMTVSQYFDALKLPAADRQNFLNNYACAPEDNLADTFWKEIEKDDLAMRKYRRTADASKPAIKQSMIFDAILETYQKNMPKRWHNEGINAYKKGLHKTDLKELENGERMKSKLGPEIQAAVNELKQSGVDYDAMHEQMEHENFLKNHEIANEKVLSGKRLYMRHEYGFSEAISADSPSRITERLQVTSGAIEKLSGMSSRWEHHSTNSTKYNNVVNALKAYNESLARNDGGKIHADREKMLKCALAYIDGKEGLRRSTNGRTRFDIIMTLLHEELKPEEFQKLIDRVNGKRKDPDKVDVDKYIGLKNSMISESATVERRNQQNSAQNATTLRPAAGVKLMDMDNHYKPDREANQLEEDETTLPAVGKRGTVEQYRLSARDFAAITFANSLSSSKRENVLNEEDVLLQNAEAVADGKKATNIALKEYGEGDKMPLANLLSIGIRKLNAEAIGKNADEKGCIREMSQRLLNLLDRDPELKKYATRQGLKEEDIETAKKLDQRDAVIDGKVARSESLISLS